MMASIHCHRCLAVSRICLNQTVVTYRHCLLTTFPRRTTHTFYKSYIRHIIKPNCIWTRSVAYQSDTKEPLEEETTTSSINNIGKKVEIYSAAQNKLKKLTPAQPPNPHLLKVSIIGAPNAGKSTLANQLIGWRFASVSKKVHTTRHNSLGILSENNKQVVFLDTPGLINTDKIRKHKLEKSLLTDPYSSLFETDIIIAVVDVSHVWNRSKLDRDVLTALALHSNKKSILVLNKVDLVKRKRDLLEISRLLTDGIIGGKPACHFVHDEAAKTPINVDILDKLRRRDQGLQELQETEEENEMQNSLANLEVPGKDGLTEPEWWQKYTKKMKQVRRLSEDWRGWPKFDKLFMISALEADGVPDIKEYLLDCTYPESWMYDGSMITDMDPMEIVHMCVREKLLDHLPREIPYNVKIAIRNWEVDDDGRLIGTINLLCKRKRDIVHIIGPNGDIMRKIREEIKQELMNTFKREISLHIRAVQQVNPDWS